MSESSPKYSIVIPVFNSTVAVEELINRIARVFSETIHESYEVILVDDGSPNPDTWPFLQSLTERAEVRAFNLTRNFGKPGALICGFNQIQGEYVFTMDDDLQHRPEDIPKFIEARAHDIVLGSIANKQHSIFKRVTSRIKSWLDYRLISKPKGIYNSPFRLIKRKIVDEALKINTANPYISALLFYCTRDVVNVAISHEARKYGKTGYTFKKMVSHFSNLIVNNSSLLIKGVTYLGIMVASLSFLGGVFIIYKKLVLGISVIGWTSIIVLILAFGGITLLAIGILGEYMSRIISGVENRPSYIIKEEAK